MRDYTAVRMYYENARYHSTLLGVLCETGAKHRYPGEIVIGLHPRFQVLRVKQEVLPTNRRSAHLV